jgi:hypothetical protein
MKFHQKQVSHKTIRPLLDVSNSSEFYKKEFAPLSSLDLTSGSGVTPNFLYMRSPKLRIILSDGR